MKHSNIPWEIVSKFVGPLIIKSGDTEIAHVGGDSFGLVQANAAFIVRACNAHDELVAFVDAIAKRDMDAHAGLNFIIECARELSTKARGEA